MDRLLGALTLPALPLWAAATALHPRWRRDWAARWGVEVPPVEPGAVWVHAASVGEVTAAAAIVDRLPDPVLLTADTDTGVRRARALLGHRPGVAVGAKPVDHPLPLAPLWAEARPRAVVFVEGTFWPALAWRARRAGVPVLRVSARAGRRTRALGPLLGPWFAPVDRVLARDAEAAAFLARVHAAPVEVAGDPKADRGAPAPVLRWSRPFAVLGCARPGDAARVLRAIEPLDPRPALLVAPRHPDRFDPAELGARPWVRRSALAGGEVPADVDVVVLDTLGELAACYPGARFAVIGGTFDSAIGGHAPYEAAAAGVPVVAGPCVRAHAAAFAAAGAAVAADGDLGAAIARARPPPAPDRGAADRIARRVIALAGEPAPEACPRPWLLPAGAAVALAHDLRRWAHAAALAPQVSVGVPVIAVASTNARSPGRTSTVRALVAVLAAQGARVGVSVRGYRRARPGRDVRLSTASLDPADLGDEGALLARAGAVVAAGPDRVAAARALRDAGATVIVLDDGGRHRTLRHDLRIAVVDARYPGARGPVPAGERRERRFVPDDADLVLVHHAGRGFAFPGHPVERVPGPWTRGDGGEGPFPGPVAAFAGIGRPAAFLASLEVPVARFLALPDHAPLDADRLSRWAGDLPLATTAKDAVRLPDALRPRAMWRDVEVRLPDAVHRAVADLLHPHDHDHDHAPRDRGGGPR